MFKGDRAGSNCNNLEKPNICLFHNPKNSFINKIKGAVLDLVCTSRHSQEALFYFNTSKNYLGGSMGACSLSLEVRSCLKSATT